MQSKKATTKPTNRAKNTATSTTKSLDSSTKSAYKHKVAKNASILESSADSKRAKAKKQNATKAAPNADSSTLKGIKKRTKKSMNISLKSTIDSAVPNAPKATKLESRPDSAPNATKLKRPTKQDIATIKALFLANFNNAKTELVYHNLYELLVCVMLSAQCTDKRVNIVTPKLFKAYPNIEALAHAPIEKLKDLIKSVSFFNNKAKHLKSMANQVLSRHNGEIPTTQEALKSLDGVGQKTANVVLIEYFEANYMAVDTHVFRVSHRLGLSNAKSALETEKELSSLFQTHLATLHQAFVLFGRYTCKALKPLCQECFVAPFCQNTRNFKPN